MRRQKIAIVVRMADRRLGIITRAQLSSFLTRAEIERLVKMGVIVRVHRGVYRLAGSQPSARQHGLAAALACGEGAVVSHRSGAALWGLVETKKGPVHITVPRERSPEHDGIIVHRALYLPKTDVTELMPIPITRVPRTIADLEDHLREEALDEAIRRRLITPYDVLGYNRRLDKLALDRLEHGAPEKKIERLAIAALKEAGLPPAKRQYWVRIDGENYRIDLAYPEHKIAIELEGEAPHWGRQRWQSDHERRNALELDHWRQLSYTWWDARHEPEKLGSQVGRLLKPV